MATEGRLGSCSCQCGGGSCSQLRVIGVARLAGNLPINGKYWGGNPSEELPYTGHWPRGTDHPDVYIIATLNGGIRQAQWAFDSILRTSTEAETRYLKIERHRTWSVVYKDEFSGLNRADRSDAGGVDETVIIDADTGIEIYWESYIYCNDDWHEETSTLNEDGTTTNTVEHSQYYAGHGVDWSVAGQGSGSWSADVSLTGISASGTGDADYNFPVNDRWHAYWTIEEEWTLSQPYVVADWKAKAQGLLDEVNLSLTSQVSYHNRDAHGTLQTWTPTPGFTKAFVVLWEWGAGVAKHKCIRAADSYYDAGIAANDCGGVHAWNGRLIENTAPASTWCLARAVKSMLNFCTSYWSAIEVNFGVYIRFDLLDREIKDVVPFNETGIVRKYLRVCVKGQTLVCKVDTLSGRFAAFIHGNPPVRVYVTPHNGMMFAWDDVWLYSQAAQTIDLDTTPIQQDENVVGSGE